MKPAIRPLAANDKPAIMRILQQVPEFEPEEVVVAEELIDCYLQDSVASGYLILVAESDSMLAGYVCYGNTPLTKGTWDIYWMAVDPSKQSKGIGKALLSSAEEDIASRKGRLIIIETSSKPMYEKTRQFHRARGYERIGRIADFYAPGDDKLIYQKRLG